MELRNPDATKKGALSVKPGMPGMKEKKGGIREAGRAGIHRSGP
jgi:hypothetical protein